MKVKTLGNPAKAASTGISSMPGNLRVALNGMTINEALAAGVIDDLGTKTGVFAVPHNDPNIDRWYAIVQGHAVPLSTRATENAQDGKLDDDIISNMKFQSGISNVAGDGNGKAWFNLGMGGTLNLDTEAADAVKLGAVPVDHK